MGFESPMAHTKYQALNGSVECFFLGAPGMAQTLGGATSTGVQRKSSPLRTRQGESLAITARVSIARWNLKEAGGKALARRTGIVYKAAALDERANRLKVQ